MKAKRFAKEIKLFKSAAPYFLQKYFNSESEINELLKRYNLSIDKDGIVRKETKEKIQLSKENVYQMIVQANNTEVEMPPFNYIPDNIVIDFEFTTFLPGKPTP